MKMVTQWLSTIGDYVYESRPEMEVKTAAEVAAEVAAVEAEVVAVTAVAALAAVTADVAVTGEEKPHYIS